MDTYEQKYKEALAKCKAYIDDTQKRWSEEFCKATEEVFFEIFPGLKESEDERIRKEIISALKNANYKGIYDKHLAWLEKQGEKKEINPTLQEKERMDDAFTKMMLKPQVDGFDAELNALLKKYECLPKEEVVECLQFYLKVVQGEQKPKWTEEDSLMIDSIVDTIKWLEGKGATNMKIDWLKSLKQRMEEQQ